MGYQNNMASKNEQTTGPVPQRRRRIGRACDMCRQRKVKCDGAKPKCKSCFLFDYDCTYTDSLNRRTSYRDFNEVLESRLMQIESTVNKLVQTQPTIAQNLLAQLQGLSDPLGEEERLSLAKLKKEPVEEQFLVPDDIEDVPISDESEDDELEASVHNLSLEDRNRCRYFGPSSGMYLLNQGKFYKNSTLFEKKYLKAPGGSSNPEIEFELMCDPSIDFLTPEMLSQLLEIYFERFHPYLPLFHKGDFLRRIYSNDKPPAILVNAALAIACIHSGNSDLYSNPTKVGSSGDVFFNRAKNLLDKQYRVSRVTTVQALLLMSIFSSDGWLFLGMAIRMAQDIGLHRHLKKASRSNMDFIEIENRKRVWWACFVVDRIISASLGRPISIDENDFDTKLVYTSEEEPTGFHRGASMSSDNSQELPSPQQAHSDVSLRYFVQLIKLSFIFGRVLKTIYAVRTLSSSRVSSMLIVLNKALYEWKSALPSEFDYNVRSSANTPFAEIICTLYYTVLILLHRPFLPKLDQIKTLDNQPSLAICTRAANMITFMQDRALQENRITGIPLKVIGVYNSNSVYLFNIFSPIRALAQAARINLVVSIDILEKYSMSSFGATACLVFLKELFSERKITIGDRGNLVPELLENEIPCPNPSNILPVPSKRNDSDVMLLLSEYSVRHSAHTPGSSDSIGRSPVMLSPASTVSQPAIAGYVENSFDFTPNVNNPNNFNLADSMYSNTPHNDGNNIGYTPVNQLPLYPNNVQPYMSVPPNNVGINESPLFFNSFPMSMDVEEWNKYMDQNMLDNSHTNGVNQMNMQGMWSPSSMGEPS
ncbi:hypothetical protein K493DRAFT_301518 [Basidiobolus meristosporus CBS 931.73]|uniref:Zn(2)-C6 fungal-type domain-containing protein n=1 Tax=Basidiobolus meristosporus CBS 931.73 TaxID=1314790 RepID=A0A1Y1YBR8_9FUNG|nr:hypothetical protein K493DRAFT_301518 [Basidiobolus meristosporus CBS 931.73]|eukprot:ORX95365.1 hypothetical protein K493DRAFT_301518 [Basidiobolus meristosporus CBS 931.73]